MSSNAILLALFQAWVAVFVVDQNRSASLGFSITNCILAIISEVVIVRPFSTIILVFAWWSVAPSSSFVKSMDTSGYFVARVGGASVVVIASSSFE